MKTHWILFLLVFWAGPGVSQEIPDSNNLMKIGDPLPEMTLLSVDGKTIRPDHLTGKVVLINFFATNYIPRSYLFNREGDLVYMSRGYSEGEFNKLKEKLSKLLD